MHSKFRTQGFHIFLYEIKFLIIEMYLTILTNISIEIRKQMIWITVEI